MAKIEVISSSVIEMANNPSAKSRMLLTPWDLQFLLNYPLQRGILFHKPPQSLQKTLIDHLKDSLSRTLDFFPPLAGRLATVDNHDKTTSYFVDCNNTGVEFVHAVAGDVCVSDILEPAYVPEIVHSLLPLNDICNYEGVSKPLLAVQVTELIDGIFIGCTANHVVVDGTSFWHFFNSWSEISRGFGSISKSPVFDRWFPSSVADEDRLVPLPPLELQQNLGAPPLVLKRVFHFSKEILSKLKAKANAEGGTDKISSLQALTAHLWRSSTRSRQSPSQEVRIVVIVGARGRIISLPDGYFGNAVYADRIAISEVELLQKGLGYAARKINELVRQQTEEAAIRRVEDWMKNPTLRKRGIAYAFLIAVTSSPRYDVYGNDFGWGKPIAVRSGKAQLFDGNMIVYPAAVAGGIDVEVCLAAEVLQAMGDDAEFMGAFSI